MPAVAGAAVVSSTAADTIAAILLLLLLPLMYVAATDVAALGCPTCMIHVTSS